MSGLLVVAGCGTGLVEVVAPLPAHSFGPDIDSNAYEGVLRLEGRCVYLAGVGADLNILWPAGYGLKGNPPLVVRYDGATIAAIGDEVFIGGLPIDDQLATPGCSVRHVLALGIVATVNGIDVPAPATEPAPPAPAMTERNRPR
jgi:hypothetical protein